MHLKVIVSGAGIAGLALAYWLQRLGAQVIVVERAPRFEPLGHYITLKGNGVEMVRRMGIVADCEARAAPLHDGSFYSVSGKLLRTEGTAGLAQTLGGYILFRRADLARALYECVREKLELRLGTQIRQLKLEKDRAEVIISDGKIEHCDLVVGADGVHSHTRYLVFGDGFERPLGGYYVAFTIKQRHGLLPVVRTYLGVGAMAALLPVAEDTISGVIYLSERLSARAGRPPHHDALAMRDYLKVACAQFAPEVRRVLDGLSADDFVFSDSITQIEMPRIISTRCALIGDAAHCPTFLSGMGSSLALQDAHLLAGCLARNQQNLAHALTRYEQVVTPIARRYHDSARRMHGILLNQSHVKAALRDLALRLIPESVLQKQVRRFYDSERPLAEVPTE